MRPEERNKIMNSTTHKERRLRGDLITIYKNIDDDQLFTMKNNDRTRSHSVKQSDLKQHCISHRAISEWTNLI